MPLCSISQRSWHGFGTDFAEVMDLGGDADSDSLQ